MANRTRTCYLSVWLSTTEAQLLKTAPKEQRSDLVRRMLAYAATHMPRDWSPETPPDRKVNLAAAQGQYPTP